MSLALTTILKSLSDNRDNSPRTLNLPSADEIVAMDNLDVLRLNGYDVLIDEDADVGERVKLIAQPVSKDTVFDVGGTSFSEFALACRAEAPLSTDFEELVDLIGTRSGGEVVRPSKARRMFASRACRKSVMIGKALNAKQMTTVRRLYLSNRSCLLIQGKSTDPAAHGWHGPTLGTLPPRNAYQQFPLVPLNLSRTTGMSARAPHHALGTYMQGRYVPTQSNKSPRAQLASLETSSPCDPRSDLAQLLTAYDDA